MKKIFMIATWVSLTFPVIANAESCPSGDFCCPVTITCTGNTAASCVSAQAFPGFNSFALLSSIHPGELSLKAVSAAADYPARCVYEQGTHDVVEVAVSKESTPRYRLDDAASGNRWVAPKNGHFVEDCKPPVGVSPEATSVECPFEIFEDPFTLR